MNPSPLTAAVLLRPQPVLDPPERLFDDACAGLAARQVKWNTAL